MPETLDRLRQEHRDIAGLLDILEAELADFDAAASPDFDIISAIADYFSGYPEACHHPKEDRLYEALLVHRPDCAALVGDVVAEHRSLGNLVKQFADAVGNVMRDAEVSRVAFDHVVRQFIDAQRRHIDKEESGLFPLAANTLTEADWAAIDAQIADADDPLFGKMPEARFAGLRKNIAEWEAERTGNP